MEQKYTIRLLVSIIQYYKPDTGPQPNLTMGVCANDKDGLP